MLPFINSLVYNNIRLIEIIGVLMRIFSFSLVSWLGAESPFMFVWSFNTVDAILLSWCALLKKDVAYSILNIFWILVGVVGLLRACDC
ncbi:hypothetical protein, partial [Methylocucumis oryzae]